ncbi:N-acetyltransferase [Lacibacter luteus]|uniref:N-acetyltransferase n=1 Tax=Lacibacter luteus TaxID=2508719 RepID=A0A4Q1CJ89_9BACT|nr:GNAT family protein [Lacibacter luteus]RXK60418.1 N-acetyltransferase [Lacibacter luteus]
MIRKATSSDFHFLYYLYMHPQVNPYLLYEYMQQEDFHDVFNELQHKGVLYIFEELDEDIGMFKLMPQRFRNAHIAYLGGVAIDPEEAGKGFGLQMMEEIIAFAKQQGYLRIELTVATSNTKAIQLYQKAGFHHEGVLKKYTYLKSKDQYVDEAVMAYIFDQGSGS